MPVQDSLEPFIVICISVPTIVSVPISVCASPKKLYEDFKCVVTVTLTEIEEEVLPKGSTSTVYIQ